jgi:hypothetical protein
LIQPLVAQFTLSKILAPPTFHARHSCNRFTYSTGLGIPRWNSQITRASRLVGKSQLRFLADRGFADTRLMRYLRYELQWHFRIRVKSNAWIYRPHRGWKQLNQYHLNAGDSILLQGITLTKSRPLAELNVALARDPLSAELWLVVTDEPASLQTFQQYSERFQIEEELLDEKSNGF